MSKMNDLTIILEEMTETGRALITCGENLIKAVRSMQHWPGATESPETDTRFPKEDAPTDPGSGNTPDAGKPSRRARAPKPEAPAAEKHAPAPKPAGPLESESRNKPEEAPQCSKEEIRAMLAALADNGRREEAKVLVQKYANGGSFSNIEPALYPELAKEVKQYE